MKANLPISTVIAGLITVLVGYTSSAAIVFDAARSAGATPAQLASWLWALGLAMGVTCIGLSFRYKAPVVTAWSTPGAALLATSLTGYSMNQAIGIFLFSALLIMIAGFSGVFEKMADRIPVNIASAMLAGVLLHYGVDVFGGVAHAPILIGAMLVTYLVMKKFAPRYAILLVLLVGIGTAVSQGQMSLAKVGFEFTRPEWITPEFSVKGLIGVGIPLFLVTMASQNLPGVAVLRANGYQAPVSRLIGWTGVTNFVLAPLGCFAVNLAAITAAICAGPESHEDVKERYKASMAAGFFYLILGLLGATVGALFNAFPHELVLGLAGIALFGTIGQSLSVAMRDDLEREAALITLLVTASGIKLFDIGAAFWGLLAGLIVRQMLVKR